MGLPTFINVIEITPQKHVQRHITQMIPDPVRLTAQMGLKGERREPLIISIHLCFLVMKPAQLPPAPAACHDFSGMKEIPNVYPLLIGFHYNPSCGSNEFTGFPYRSWVRVTSQERG